MAEDGSERFYIEGILSYLKGCEVFSMLERNVLKSNPDCETCDENKDQCQDKIDTSENVVCTNGMLSFTSITDPDTGGTSTPTFDCGCQKCRITSTGTITVDCLDHNNGKCTSCQTNPTIEVEKTADKKEFSFLSFTESPLASDVQYLLTCT